MKRIFCLMIVIWTMMGSCLAEGSAKNDCSDGIFVPSFESFMNAFTDQMDVINGDISARIRKKGIENNAWVRFYSVKYEFSDDSTFEFSASIANKRFVKEFKFQFYGKEVPEHFDLCKEIIAAGIRAMNPGIEEEDVAGFFNGLLYDEITTSPVQSMLQDYYYGIYKYHLQKSYGTIYDFEIEVY